MYVRLRKRGSRGMAGTHRLSGVGRLRGVSRLGDGIDWGDTLNNAISTAGQVATVALKPPTYSSIVSPNGATSISAYGPIGSSGIFSGTGLGGSLTGSLSPLLLLGLVGLGVVLLVRR
jgi:hypothetical protein